MSQGPEGVGRLLENGVIGSLRAQLEDHARLLDAVRRCLPDVLGGHCRHCLITQDNRLLIYVDSPAWASQLRFFGPRLASCVEGVSARPIREVRVRNLLDPPPARRSPRPAPRAGSGVDWLRTSAALLPDGEIRRSLLRLWRTLTTAVETDRS
ncbi:DciA family protein [Candidatus Methylocalor cossyra]|uniref:DUF721 domain-containing protein n=1 Tax=Candidatus Methylocalor cossyra TaxID=3108543 RepID=A0ABP1C7R1_9GAMM